MIVLSFVILGGALALVVGAPPFSVNGDRAKSPGFGVT
jgi:hypothetical protein